MTRFEKLENNVFTVETKRVPETVVDKEGSILNVGDIIDPDQFDDKFAEICTIVYIEQDYKNHVILYKNFKTETPSWQESHLEYCSPDCTDRLNGSCVNSFYTQNRNITLLKRNIKGICTKCISACKEDDKKECDFYEGIL